MWVISKGNIGFAADYPQVVLGVITEADWPLANSGFRRFASLRNIVPFWASSGFSATPFVCPRCPTSCQLKESPMLQLHRFKSAAVTITTSTQTLLARALTTTSIPTYASPCSVSASYSSACSCIGVFHSTVTVSTPARYSTVLTSVTLVAVTTTLTVYPFTQVTPQTTEQISINIATSTLAIENGTLTSTAYAVATSEIPFYLRTTLSGIDYRLIEGNATIQAIPACSLLPAFPLLLLSQDSTIS